MFLKYINFLNGRPSKIYPNWDFGFENKPSGNPGAKPQQMWHARASPT
jgi:hypothetical protein